MHARLPLIAYQSRLRYSLDLVVGFQLLWRKMTWKDRQTDRQMDGHTVIDNWLPLCLSHTHAPRSSFNYHRYGTKQCMSKAKCKLCVYSALAFLSVVESWRFIIVDVYVHFLTFCSVVPITIFMMEVQVRVLALFSFCLLSLLLNLSFISLFCYLLLHFCSSRRIGCMNGASVDHLKVLKRTTTVRTYWRHTRCVNVLCTYAHLRIL